LEHAVFNGDEPVGPFIGPQWHRVGDSRTTRLTLMPTEGVELQASRAFVRSPGISQGGAFDHTQTHVSLRIDRPASSTMAPAIVHDMSNGPMMRDRRYLLVEVARTDEGFGRQRAFRYNSMLAEAAIDHRGWGLAARAERTDRPESERLLDPFRIANGHIDFQIIGITRWTVGSLHVDTPQFSLPRFTALHATPFVELSRAQPEALRQPAVFIPRDFYGASSIWSLTAGVRVHVGVLAGPMRMRMGRYGVLDAAPSRDVHP
jgi:hypothetical protein